MSTAIIGATVIDGTGAAPVPDGVIVVDGGRITAIGDRATPVPPGAERIDATGKYVIPGLMNANVHLSLGVITAERAARHLGELESVVVEAAQVALKYGQTTVFDTCGFRRPLVAVRDRIDRGEVVGSRFFCCGWIIGFDGPFSADFNQKASEVVTSAFAKRVNAMSCENIGRHLMWLTPEGVAQEVRAYIGRSLDFIKYGSNEHCWASAGAFLAFSPRAQEAMVQEAHRAGITAQAHVMSVEGLRIAVEAGCDLITHANMSGPVPIPQETLDLMAKKGTGAVIFPLTDRGMEWIRTNGTEIGRTMWAASDTNARNFIRSGAPLMMANDGMIFGPEWRADPKYKGSWTSAPDEINLGLLSTGHFVWFKAMEEKGCPPMEMLKAATRNIAVAYGKGRDLGTLERGKIADLVVLDKDPLRDADNYRSIAMVMKDGAVVDRDALPRDPILTRPEPPAEEEAVYKEALAASAALPPCGCGS